MRQFLVGRSLWHRSLLLAGQALLAAVALTWTWNEIAVELFTAPPAAFRHGLSAVVLVLVVACTVQAAWRMISHRQE